MGLMYLLKIGKVDDIDKPLIDLSLIPVHIVGVALNAFIYGGGIGALTAIAGLKATYPWFYFIIGGIIALSIIAPSGKTNFFAGVESLIFYIGSLLYFLNNPSVAGTIMAKLFEIWFWILLVAIGAIILWSVISSRKESSKARDSQKSNR